MSGPQPVNLQMESQAISWAPLPPQNPAAACGLELAENVRLNNFLPTAAPDALHIAGLSDIDLLQDGILLFLLP